MTAKDGTKWADTPTYEHQVARRNIVRQRCGPSRNTDMLTILDTFKLFFTPEIANIIIRHTNKKANLTYATYNEKNPGKKQLVWKNLEHQELYAFLAILITSGANNSKTDNTKDMWQLYSYPLYRAIMGISCFWNIICFIRFYNANTRAKRMEMNKAAPIRDIWRMLNNNLAKHYKPTEHLTIDEQLCSLCIFHQNQPNLESKYGGYVMQKTRELLLHTHGSNVNSVPCRVPKSSAVNTSCTPKPRKSFIRLTNRMKRKRTDSLREQEVEELQHAVKRFKSNSSTDGRAILYGSNLSLQALCNLKLTDRTWTEFKNIVTHNRHLVPPGLTKLKQYKKLTYPEQVEYSETEVKCSLFHMIKHSVSRVFEYLLDYESNCIMSLSQEERNNVQIICKVGGDGQSDQSEFQNSATMKRGVDDRSVYSIVFVLLEI
ncbi:uncharacterized protein LOC136093186 [Hydra vulgaris]|uniref:uncharacterized protein LOC136093186 n=1 Tax=Hydra vulgaris TaxID=6087 RepID=UPI0032EA3310